MSLFSFINTVIPFSDPSRPLWRDVVLSIIICTFLWFAPQLQRDGAWRSLVNSIQKHRNSSTDEPEPEQPVQEPLPEADDDEHEDVPAIIPNHTAEDNADDNSEEDEEWERIPPHILNPGLNAGEPAAGPAGPPNPPPPRPHQPPRQRDPNRVVGAKKAKSIARRNQIRAYHEFMREQGDMQRAMDASTAKAAAKEVALERERRSKIEAEIYEREQRERAARKEREAKERAKEAEAISAATRIITDALKSCGMVELASVVAQVQRDVQWGEVLIKHEGILGLKNESGKKSLTLLTGKGWVVRIDEDDVNELYRRAAMGASKASLQATVQWQELGEVLGHILTNR